MVNDFEWAIETPTPILYEGAKFIINKDSERASRTNCFMDGSHILFVVESFSIGCINDNIGKEVMNFTILENTQKDKSKYKVDYFGEVNLERAYELIEEGWFIPYEEI